MAEKAGFGGKGGDSLSRPGFGPFGRAMFDREELTERVSCAEWGSKESGGVGTKEIVGCIGVEG